MSPTSFVSSKGGATSPSDVDSLSAIFSFVPMSLHVFTKGDLPKKVDFSSRNGAQLADSLKS